MQTGRSYVLTWKLVNDHWLTGRTPRTDRRASGSCNVSECEFPKEVDRVSQIRTGTALGDIHVADRLSRTSCSLHPESWPLLKGISTLSDKQLPEGLLSVPGVLRFLNIPDFCFKNAENKGKSDMSKPNFMGIPEKYCSWVLNSGKYWNIRGKFLYST